MPSDPTLNQENIGGEDTDVSERGKECVWL